MKYALKSLLILSISLGSLSVFAQSKKALKLYEKGKKAMEGNYYVQSVVDFTNAIAKDRTFADAYFQRGISFLGLGRQEAAIKDFKETLEHDPKHLLAYINMFRQLKSLGDHAGRLRYADMMENHLPGQQGAVYFERGGAYEGQGKMNLAVESYQKAINIYESDTEHDFSEIIQICKDKLSQLKQ